MAILVKADTKVLVQGITGSFGGRHTQLSLESVSYTHLTLPTKA